ncbi:MAG: hypothetical protein AAB215_09365 [Planctomycetota bacterium]
MALLRLLSSARARWRRSEAASEALGGLALALPVAAAACALDQAVHLPGVVRLAVALGLAFVLGAAAFRTARTLLRRLSDAAVAVHVERAAGIRDNLLVNAVLLAPAPGGSSEEAFRAEVARQADALAVRIGSDRRACDRVSGRLFASAAAGVLLAGLFAALLPEEAWNSLCRLASPFGGRPPLSDLRFRLTPAHARILAGDDLAVRAEVRSVRNEPPASACAVFESASGVRRIPLLAASVQGAPDRQTFAGVLPAVPASGRWFVEAGASRSPEAVVEAVLAPEPRRVEWRIRRPAYTGGGEEKPPPDSKALRVLPGSSVSLSFESEPAASKATLSAGVAAIPMKASRGRFEAVFEASAPASLRLDLSPAADPSLRRSGALRAELGILSDRLCEVAFEGMPAAQILPPGAVLPVRIAASDDWGLASIRLTAQEGEPGSLSSAGRPRVVKAWDYRLPGPASAREVFPLALDPASFAPGRAYTLTAVAADFLPGGRRETASSPIVVRIASPESVTLAKDSSLGTFLEELKRLLEMQREAHAALGSLREFLDEHWAAGRIGRRVSDIESRQREIRERSIALAGRMRRTEGAAEPAARLSVLATGPMARVQSPLEAARKSTDKSFAGASLAAGRVVQKEILDGLAALLGSLAAADARIAEAERKRKSEDFPRTPESVGRDLADRLKAFLEDQRRIIETTQALDAKKPDDLTDKDEKLLSDAAAKEAEWAKWFQDAKEDLSRLPPQDFSDSSLAKEWNEAFMEIQKASDALSAHKTEIAVPREQAGLELAKKLETNLEKWLPDTPDTQKWTMEEPANQAEVPLADLPEELEDIVGELLDDQDKMEDDVQDASSAWMDSLDKGAGWDAMDGPISNMSAKGVTGNRLPNDQEVGGRSGEGRTGKSSGQFVEEEAAGKGGKETPTRLTEDPFESGSVKSSANETAGGATGGGKLAGTAGEGLRGAPKPPVPPEFDKLAAKQAEIRQKAERMSRTLNAYRLPSGDMDVAARRMAETEQALKSGRVGSVRQSVHDAVESLRASKASLSASADWAKEKGAVLSPEVRREILTGLRDEPPAAYKDLVSAYFRALAEKGDGK